jgi:hypothetical protein
MRRLDSAYFTLDITAEDWEEVKKNSKFDFGVEQEFFEYDSLVDSFVEVSSRYVSRR